MHTLRAEWQGAEALLLSTNTLAYIPMLNLIGHLNWYGFSTLIGGIDDDGYQPMIIDDYSSCIAMVKNG